ncbi:cation diffusion facilitator family transporter [Bacteroidales bacterium OttesenSCG-928-B11]|nr:cation diffusion facilitator family transporter [Bacteroidales bacterium OttesenSCG-928-E04]MDL2312421.1 cation diffusion facilitator family transporter [Bacteroidales bacterium OttesenSCG-928-B11]MDL2326324.1 cation diffusion facilitator family transporter [Bacteroidales bacterium OttesenSCG-928-A14]
MGYLPEKKREKGIYRVTIIGSIVNLLLVIAKFIAGILGRSAAMTADAVHSLSDFISDIIVIVFVKISGKPKDEDHKYGHGKYETLATLMIGLILLVVGVMIAYNGIYDIIAVIKGAVLESPGMIAFWAALISIAFKEVLYRYTVIQGKKLKSDVVIANAWHHRSDAFSSIGTALGIGGAVFFGQQWTVLDPIAAVIVSVFIIKTAMRLMKPAVDELMERSLPEETENEIKDIANSFEGVSGLHNLCTRKIGNCCAIEFHIRMDGGIALENAHQKITKIEKALREKYGSNTHVMIHMEPI